MFPVDSRRWEIERLSIMLNKSFYCQSGFSIVELMVGVTVGLLVVSTVVAIYGVVAKSGAEILGSAKLNEELRAAMDMMVGDIRRAGVWVPDNSNEREDNPNPYTIRNSTPMTDVNIADGGKCIEFAYDAAYLGGGETPDDDNDFFGYKYTSTSDGKAIAARWRRSVDTPCTTVAVGEDWRRLTDEKNIEILNLTFSTEGSQCFNASKPASNSSPLNPWRIAITGTPYLLPACDSATPGYNAASGDRLIESRQIIIRLSGQLKSNIESMKDFKMDLVQGVRVANDRVMTAN